VASIGIAATAEVSRWDGWVFGVCTRPGSFRVAVLPAPQRRLHGSILCGAIHRSVYRWDGPSAGSVAVLVWKGPSRSWARSRCIRP